MSNRFTYRQWSSQTLAKKSLAQMLASGEVVEAEKPRIIMKGPSRWDITLDVDSVLDTCRARSAAAGGRAA